MHKNKIIRQLFSPSLLVIFTALLIVFITMFITVNRVDSFSYLLTDHPSQFIMMLFRCLFLAIIAGIVGYSTGKKVSDSVEQQQIADVQREQDIVFSNMKEGLFFIDRKNRITKLNKAASELLSIDINDVYEKTVQETIKNNDFYAYISKALEADSSMQAEFVMDGQSKTYIQSYSVPIFNENNRRNGVLIVIHDITNIKKLETVRQDFISNVSHELKTPITSIQGFVETLLEDELDDPEEIRNFLRIIKKHIGRLKSIIEDLLSLSRLEQDVARSEISFTSANIKDILKTAVQTCEMIAKSKSITLNLTCDEDMQAVINPLLIEQAVINLIDNAIKYSDEHCTVSVSALKDGNSNVIKVEDNGIGIPQEHLSRIFERFYRVDKARSKKFGGTGLGLAIVKHIIQLHNGQVSVESEPNKGSTFYIHLPERL